MYKAVTIIIISLLFVCTCNAQTIRTYKCDQYNIITMTLTGVMSRIKIYPMSGVDDKDGDGSGEIAFFDRLIEKKGMYPGLNYTYSPDDRTIQSHGYQISFFIFVAENDLVSDKEAEKRFGKGFSNAEQSVVDFLEKPRWILLARPGEKISKFAPAIILTSDDVRYYSLKTIDGDISSSSDLEKYITWGEMGLEADKLDHSISWSKLPEREGSAVKTEVIYLKQMSVDKPDMEKKIDLALAEIRKSPEKHLPTQCISQIAGFKYSLGSRVLVKEENGNGLIDIIVPLINSPKFVKIAIDKEGKWNLKMDGSQ